MDRFNSITCRITGLMFLAVALTVFLLIYLANEQMIELFQEYLVVQQMETHMGDASGHLSGGGHSMTGMGPLEESFLASVHQSLIWVGLAILATGLAASYTLARSITVPLRNLSRAARKLEQGDYDQKVVVETKDEIGELADIFNRMAETLATNTNLRRQLLANIAHELKTPLTVIQGHLEGMVDGVIAANKEQLLSLHEEAVRLNRLLKDLRDLSLAEVRQLALEKRPTDINQLVGRAVAMLKPLADAKDIQISCSLAAALPEISIDRDRMSQVIYNILVNAVRYSPPKGRVEVTTVLREEDLCRRLTVSVADNGPGIETEDIPYIFDHFYRSDKSRDRKSGGSGLGLAIVKQLVEIHGGQVTVSSQKEKGTIFRVVLPVE
ncbi:sensor histidine kinase [Acetonema longum]|uniref:histidine kinase n=1 Tax=Acetonema longum DSM 6540 TaxID=1009370 RepID=F7NGM2_9FIRM|nr:ATP-binding protein [Acetonema longum]EGO64826.1 integral membrane sensor signal transduction histidine kinase [Acetonema longum DSM 6540]